MNKLRFLPVTGILLATAWTVAACGPAGASHSAAPPVTRQAAPATDAASASTTPADAETAAPAGSASITVSPTPTAFADALAAWKNAAAANAAIMGMYLQQAADDLRASGNPGYGPAIDELTYLEHLPATNDTPTQQANARSDVQALDTFFGTPGLMS